jgi:hypothetical protein
MLRMELKHPRGFDIAIEAHPKCTPMDDDAPIGSPAKAIHFERHLGMSRDVHEFAPRPAPKKDDLIADEKVHRKNIDLALTSGCVSGGRAQAAKFGKVKKSPALLYSEFLDFSSRLLGPHSPPSTSQLWLKPNFANRLSRTTSRAIVPSPNFSSVSIDTDDASDDSGRILLSQRLSSRVSLRRTRTGLMALEKL